MRLLFDRFSRHSDRGFTENDFLETCAEVAGPGLDPFIDECVNGTAELDIGFFLGFAGLRLEARDGGPPGSRGHLGVSLKTIDGNLTIVAVTAGSPAYEQGLNVGDEILAIDGFRVSQGSLAQHLSEATPGSRVEILCCRAGRIRCMPIVLGAKPPGDWFIVRVDASSVAQQRIFESWLAARW
jgi:predicted metalloprotease with PDZ domain